MKSIVTTLFVLLMMPVFGQRKPKEVFKAIDTIQIGRWIETGKNITAVCYTTKEDLGTVNVDSSGNVLVLKHGRSSQMNGSKYRVSGFQLNGMLMLWQADQRTGSADFSLRNHTILQFEKNLTARDVFTYEKLWENNGRGYLWDDTISPLLVIGNLPKNSRFSQTGENSILNSIDPVTGELYWSSTHNFNNGLLRYAQINDSCFLMVGDGIRRYHLKKGLQWKLQREYWSDISFFSNPQRYEGISNNYDYIFPASYTNTNAKIWNITSNLALDSLTVYSLNGSTIESIDLASGQPIWSYFFINQPPSHSRIYINDNKLIQVDMGWVDSPVTRWLFGQPAIRLFDKTNGHLLWEKTLKLSDDFINDVYFYAKDTVLYLLFKNRIESYSALNGQMINRQIIDPNASKGDYYFGGFQLWRKSAPFQYERIWNSEYSDILVHARGDIYIEYSKTLDFKRFYRKREFFRPFPVGRSGLTGLAGNTGIVVADSSGRAIVELNHKADEVLITAGYLILVCDKENQIVVLRKEDVLGEAL